MPINGRSTHGNMPPTPGNFGRHLQPCAPQALPRRCHRPATAGSTQFLPIGGSGKKVANTMSSHRDVCCTIEWKLILNRKAVGRVTEEDLVVAPSEDLEATLKTEVEDMLQTRKKRHKEKGEVLERRCLPSYPSISANQSAQPVRSKLITLSTHYSLA